MFGMTQDQLMALIRQVIPIIGGVLVGLGWLTPAGLATWTSIIMQIAGPLIVLGGIIWSLFANNKSSIIASAGGMPETSVTKTATGATITVTDPTLAKAAIDANKAAS